MTLAREFIIPGIATRRTDKKSVPTSASAKEISVVPAPIESTLSFSGGIEQYIMDISAKDQIDLAHLDKLLADHIAEQKAEATLKEPPLEATARLAVPVSYDIPAPTFRERFWGLVKRGVEIATPYKEAALKWGKEKAEWFGTKAVDLGGEMIGVTRDIGIGGAIVVRDAVYIAGEVMWSVQDEVAEFLAKNNIVGLGSVATSMGLMNHLVKIPTGEAAHMGYVGLAGLVGLTAGSTAFRLLRNNFGQDFKALETKDQKNEFYDHWRTLFRVGGMTLATLYLTAVLNSTDAVATGPFEPINLLNGETPVVAQVQQEALVVPEIGGGGEPPLYISPIIEDITNARDTSRLREVSESIYPMVIQGESNYSGTTFSYGVDAIRNIREYSNDIMLALNTSITGYDNSDWYQPQKMQDVLLSLGVENPALLIAAIITIESKGYTHEQNDAGEWEPIVSDAGALTIMQIMPYGSHPTMRNRPTRDELISYDIYEQVIAGLRVVAGCTGYASGGIEKVVQCYYGFDNIGDRGYGKLAMEIYRRMLNSVPKYVG